MNQKFDVAIIGGGPAGIFAAYELVQNKPHLQVVMIEAGADIYARKCPIAQKKVNHCINCVPCGIMRGFGGAGAYSDGKYNFTTEFGGWLQEYLPDQDVLDLIDYVDKINLSYGAPTEFFSTHNSRLRKLALSSDLHLLQAKVRHLGTENNLRILQEIYEYLKTRITILFNCQVAEIAPKKPGFSLKLIGKEVPDSLEADYLIAAPGRAGSEWFSGQCKGLGLGLYNNQVDVGVRIEIPSEVFQHITDEVYEAKLVYRTKQYGDLVRTFCMNPNGYVVTDRKSVV